MTAPPHSLSPADLPVRTRRRGRPSEDDRAAAPLYAPADLLVGTRRRGRPSEDDRAAAPEERPKLLKINYPRGGRRHAVPAPPGGALALMMADAASGRCQQLFYCPSLTSLLVLIRPVSKPHSNILDPQRDMRHAKPVAFSGPRKKTSARVHEAFVNERTCRGTKNQELLDVISDLTRARALLWQNLRLYGIHSCRNCSNRTLQTQ